jgi:hypothetical protein
MGLCKFGDNRCSYSHSREYLPEKGWWTTAEGLTSARKLYKHARVLPKEVVKVAEDYVAASFGRLGKDKAPQKKKSKNGRCQSHAFLYGGSDSEEEELNEYGFTNSDTQELLSQGVKPWDDDAYVSHTRCSYSNRSLFSPFAPLGCLGCSPRWILIAV